VKTIGRKIWISLQAVLMLSLIFLWLAHHASIVMAQSSGTFAATGNMTTPRDEHLYRRI
jgi:hypothetical protein